MILLAIESSGLTASVAVLADNKLIGEFTTNFKKTHSQTLLPMLHQVVEALDLSLEEIDAIAVSGGPGSFTGLRIGSATAKGLGMALDIPLIHVPTVDAIAYNLYGTQGVICPIMDAKRNQVYTGIYTSHRNDFAVIMSQAAMGIDELIVRINEIKEPVIFLGDGVPVHRDILNLELKVPLSFAPAHLSHQRAGAVAVLGAIYYNEGKLESAGAHRPDYLRLSQAERELAGKNKELK